MGACTECRGAKVKCDQGFPCRRCHRLGKECIPHVSKQGQGVRKKRRRAVETESSPSSCLLSDHVAGSRCATSEKKASEHNAIACHMEGDPTVTKNHFGLQHLVRQWVSLSLKRRSFELLARASTLAVHCGMSMDDILCEVPGRRGMDFLYPCLLTPVEDQNVVGRPLDIHEIPESLWNSVGIATQGGDLDETLQNRWIFIRETNKGVSRFFVSHGFERNVVSLQKIEQTYRENKKDVAELYIADKSSNAEDIRVRGFSHQISLHRKQGMVTKPTLTTNVAVITKTASGKTEIREMDQLWALSIPDLDRSFGLAEFISSEDTKLSSAEETNLFESLSVSIDDMDDGDDDFKLIYEFLKNS